MTLIDVDMAAAMIGCSRSHVHNLVERGLITNHGGRKPFRLSLEEIGAAIDAGHITTRPRNARPNVDSD